VSLAAPWRYTAIVWAVLLGFLLLGEWPDMATICGAVIVVGAGLFTLWRERQSRQAG
jgi:drug/metabolite transporter (DMT)-like permease